MGRRTVSDEAIRRWAAESTRASMGLESRTVRAGYVRSIEVERFLASRRNHV
jgi:hypothetical protein